MKKVINNQFSLEYGVKYEKYIEARLQYINGIISFNKLLKAEEEFKEIKSLYSEYIESCTL